MIKLQEFMFLFVQDAGAEEFRAKLFFSTDNDTWPKELRHECISIPELYVAIRKFNDDILMATIKEVKQKFSTKLPDGSILTFSSEEGYILCNPCNIDRVSGCFEVGEIFLKV